MIILVMTWCVIKLFNPMKTLMTSSELLVLNHINEEKHRPSVSLSSFGFIVVKYT